MKAAAVVSGLLVSMLGFSACGSAPSSNSSSKIDAAFATRVEQVCSANLAQFPLVGTFPYSNFNAEHPSPSQLPAVGAYFAENQRGNSAFEAALQSLGEPTTGANSWNKLKMLVVEFLDNGMTQVKDADAANVSAFVSTVNQSQTLSNEITSATKRDSFPTTGPCKELLFG